MLKSSQCLKCWYDLVYTHPSGPVPPNVAVHMLKCAKKHGALWCAHSGSELKPKHHALIDMSKFTMRTGSPASFSTYNDESFNALLGALARSVQPRHFALDVFE